MINKDDERIRRIRALLRKALTRLNVPHISRRAFEAAEDAIGSAHGICQREVGDEALGIRTDADGNERH